MASQVELCKQAFKALNSFKRSRALMEGAVRQEDKNYHELQMFKQFDSLELTLRAIQGNARTTESETGESDSE